MIQDNLHNETEIRRFLLGELIGGERTAFEERLITEESLFEQVQVVEDELIESYVRRTLVSTEKQKFENNFLTTQKRRERVAFTSSMLEKLVEHKESVAVKKTETGLAQASVWQSIAEFFKTPKLVFAVVAVGILLMAFTGWLLLRNSAGKQPEIVRQITPTPIITSTPTPRDNGNTQNSVVASNINSENKNGINKNTTVENVNKNQNEKKLPEQSTGRPSVITLALFTGGVRSEGKTNELKLSKETTGANLQLNLESQDYKIYRAEIIDQDGKVIYRSGKLMANKSKISTFVPARNLKKGDFIIRLYGRNAGNEDASVADYQFRVNQK